MTGIGPAKARLMAENTIRWEPGLNDPTFGGWAAALGYLAAGALALGAARRAPARSFERRFWALVGAVLLALGVNKQLDLHILLIDLGRTLALESGLYQQRRALQAGFMALAGGAGLLALAAGIAAARRRDAMVRLGLIGVSSTAAYALLRAAVFNHTGSLPVWSWTIELAGIALTGIAARRYRCDQPAGTM